MDIGLPGRDGLQLTRDLRASPQTHDLVIVAMTAHAMPDDEQRALAAGCDGYISKPIRTRTLSAEVDAFIASGRKASDGHAASRLTGTGWIGDPPLHDEDPSGRTP
jgi:CheY-like chemotaxis protein